MKASKEELFIAYASARDNYELAQAAFEYTVATIEGSSNRLTTAEANSERGQDIIRRISIIRREPIHEAEYSLEWIKKIAGLAETHRVGNCCEKSCMVFAYTHLLLEQRAQNTTLELFNTPFKDHFFTVIGRDETTDSADPRTWNKDTLICDPWVENRSYFVGEVDFNRMEVNTWKAMNRLLANKGTNGPFLLKRDVYNNMDNEPSIHSQNVMVLRAQYIYPHFSSFNQQVPMIFETWDIPSGVDSSSDSLSDEEEDGFYSPGFFKKKIKEEEDSLSPDTAVELSMNS